MRKRIFDLGGRRRTVREREGQFDKMVLAGNVVP
jgi:hypothetical protein